MCQRGGAPREHRPAGRLAGYRRRKDNRRTVGDRDVMSTNDANRLRSCVGETRGELLFLNVR